MKKNITYLLGAGASAQSMPTVAELSIALEIMHRFFIRFKMLHPSNELNRIIDTTQALLTLVKNHSSIDTLFRRISLAGLDYIQVDVINKPKEKFYCSELLSIYNLLLLFCEYSVYSDYQFYNSFQKYKKNDDGGSIENPAWGYLRSKIDLDLRYDAFFATILEKGGDNIKLPDNINILSWNYDLHLERSILNFTLKNDWDSAQKYLQLCYNDNQDITNKTFKLNGTSYAHFNTQAKENSFKLNIGDIYINGVINGLIFPFLNKTSFNGEYNEYNLNHNLFFHWDDNSNIRSKCLESIKDTQVLVIIGYTFPTFNRETDRKLYESMPKLEKVYIQAPTNSINDIKISFQSLLLEQEEYENDEIFIYYEPKNKERYQNRASHKQNIQEKKWYFMKIVGIDNINQFFIPPEF